MSNTYTSYATNTPVTITTENKYVRPDIPASATAPGAPGQWTWDEDYIYLCVAQDTWKRVAITTWS